MVTQGETPIIGQALVVHGTVRVESANGVTKVIEPNSHIFLDDRIDTGSSGAVSIVLNDKDATQLDLGRMSEMIIDEDVMAGSLPDLGDVAVEAALVADLLQNWEAFEPITPLEVVLSETDDSGTEETAAPDTLTDLGGARSTLAAGDGSNDGLDPMDYDLDMNDLIPPPEDAT